jgi:predicted acyltransferase
MTQVQPTPSQQQAAPAPRIVSLDQFRGYTVAGMFVVNFLGSYAAVPSILKHHHDYCSYADTIMPHFLFAVGFAFRLTFERRVQREGARAAYGRVIRRLLGLMLVSMVIYAPGHAAETWDRLQEIGLRALARPLKREWFQTLMHIAVTSLWVLPVIRAGAAVRIGFAVVSAVAHVALSWWFNFAWVNADPNGIDGGPLGFLTWTIPTITGTLACDAMTTGEPPRLSRLFRWAVALMALGWVLSCATRVYDVPADQVRSRRAQKLADDPVLPRAATLHDRPSGLLLAEPPFVPPPDETQRKWNYWMMSQRGGTLSYLIFGAGLSLLVYLGFHIACDRRGWRLRLFETFGTNALAAYILHGLVDEAVSPFVPGDAPGWYVTAAFAVFFGVTWLMVWTLERNRIFLRL